MPCAPGPGVLAATATISHAASHLGSAPAAEQVTAPAATAGEGHHIGICRGRGIRGVDPVEYEAAAASRSAAA
jgi:hypothetical protein